MNRTIKNRGSLPVSHNVSDCEPRPLYYRGSSHVLSVLLALALVFGCLVAVPTVALADEALDEQSTESTSAMPDESGSISATDETSGSISPADEVTVTAPKKVSGVKAASAGYASIKISWKKVADATGYVVYKATSKGGKYKKAATISGADKVSYSSKKLTSGKSYYYKVRAYKTLGSSTVYGKYSSVVSAKPKPAKVATAKAVATRSSKIKISWSKVSGASGYEIYRSTSKGGSYTKLQAVGKSAKSFTNKSLKASKTYYYKVRAYHTVSGKKIYGAFSKVVSAKTLSLPAAFKGFPKEFYFMSGVGGWATIVTINPDGTFSGCYYVEYPGETGAGYPDGTIYRCDFTGRFTSVKKVSDYEYTMKLSNLKTKEKEGTQAIAGPYRIVHTEPFGFENSTDFILYLPGRKTADLPQEFLDWVGMPNYWSKTPSKLPFYGIYNVQQEYGFYS